MSSELQRIQKSLSDKLWNVPRKNTIAGNFYHKPDWMAIVTIENPVCPLFSSLPDFQMFARILGIFPLYLLNSDWFRVLGIGVFPALHWLETVNTQYYYYYILIRRYIIILFIIILFIILLYYYTYKTLYTRVVSGQYPDFCRDIYMQWQNMPSNVCNL